MSVRLESDADRVAQLDGHAVFSLGIVLATKSAVEVMGISVNGSGSLTRTPANVETNCRCRTWDVFRSPAPEPYR